MKLNPNLFCMKMTAETMNMSNETERFNYALDLFFGMNPAKRYWILLAMYFAKNKKLQAIDNYEGNGYVMATMSVDLIGHRNIVEEWNQKGVKSRSVVAIVDNDKKDIIDEIYYGFDVDAINYLNSQPNKELGFFGIRQMEPTYLVEVAEILIGISDDWYEKNTSWAFLSILRRARRNNRFDGPFYLPEELTRLIVELLDAKDGSVYNPYAGLCSFGTAIPSSCRYYAQELSLDYVIGKLNLLLHNKTNAVCEKEDSQTNWKGNLGFDYIVSEPPFGVRCNSKYGTTERDFLFRSAMDVRHKAIGIYPSSICFDSGLSSIRVSKLVENDYIESVVLLANKTFQHTGIEPVIIVVNKNKKYKKAIRFVDASDCFETTGREIKLSVDSILSLCNTDGEHSRLVRISEVESNNFKLYPKLYFKKELDVPVGMKEVYLRDILTSPPHKSSQDSRGRVFSFVNRDSIKAKGIIKAEDLEIRAVDGRNYRVVNKDCLIFARGGRYTAKYLITNGENVYLRSMFRPFLVNTDIVEPAYLLSELSKDYFSEQLTSYGSGLSGPRISTDELLNLKILVPEVREQQLKMSLDTIEKNLETLESQKEAEYKNKMENFVLNQRQRKHAVAQVLNEILPSMENIESFILDNETVSKDSVVSRRFGTTLQAYLATVRKQLDKVATMVDNFTSQEQYGEPEVIRVEDFLSEYSLSKKNLGIPVSYHHHYEDEEIEQEVKISKKDLTQMLDNLIANAVKYGTADDIEQKYGSVDEKRKDFLIRIETNAVHDYKDPVVIRISNNGEAVSKSIALDKLFTWGIGRGTGIGCWQVKEIAEHFGGSASYEEFPNDPDGFVSEFRIVLPLVDD